MIVWVGRCGPIELREPHDFKAFKIVMESGDTAPMDVIERLSGIAAVAEDGAVWVSQQAVMALAQVDDRQGWEDSFRAMIESVRRFGWVRDDNQSVRAHIEMTSDRKRFP
jgi:hypothetical protein